MGHISPNPGHRPSISIPSPEPGSNSSQTSFPVDPSDIETVVSSSLGSTSPQSPKKSLEGRALSLGVKTPDDDSRASSPRVRLEAGRVERWKSPLTINNFQVTRDIQLENSTQWIRLINTIIQFFTSVFSPNSLPEARMQESLKNIFEQALLVMDQQTPLQNALMLKELEETYTRAVGVLSFAGIEDKNRWMNKFESQMRVFLAAHGSQMIQSVIDPEQYLAAHSKHGTAPGANVLSLAATILCSVRKGLDLPAEMTQQDTFSFDITLAARKSTNRYLVDDQGVREVADSRILEPGKWEFRAYMSLEHDIARDGALINGCFYYSLKDAVNALLHAGVAREHVGHMLSLFAQNTPGMMTASVVLGYDFSRLDLGASRMGSLGGLEIDRSNQTYKYKYDLDLAAISPEEDGSSLFGIPGGVQYHDTFKVCLGVEGDLAASEAKFTSQCYKLITCSFGERAQLDINGFKDACHKMSLKDSVLNDLEFGLLEQELEGLRQTIPEGGASLAIEEYASNLSMLKEMKHSDLVRDPQNPVFAWAERTLEDYYDRNERRLSS